MSATCLTMAGRIGHGHRWQRPQRAIEWLISYATE